MYSICLGSHIQFLICSQMEFLGHIGGSVCDLRSCQQSAHSPSTSAQSFQFLAACLVGWAEALIVLQIMFL